MCRVRIESGDDPSTAVSSCLTDNHSFEAGNVAFLGRHFKVAVDDAAQIRGVILLEASDIQLT
jgi:hypothetical protein